MGETTDNYQWTVEERKLMELIENYGEKVTKTDFDSLLAQYGDIMYDEGYDAGCLNTI